MSRIKNMPFPLLFLTAFLQSSVGFAAWDTPPPAPSVEELRMRINSYASASWGTETMNKEIYPLDPQFYYSIGTCHVSVGTCNMGENNYYGRHATSYVFVEPVPVNLGPINAIEISTRKPEGCFWLFGPARGWIDGIADLRMLRWPAGMPIHQAFYFDLRRFGHWFGVQRSRNDTNRELAEAALSGLGKIRDLMIYSREHKTHRGQTELPIYAEPAMELNFREAQELDQDIHEFMSSHSYY